MVTQISIGYKDIFDDYDIININNLLSGIPTINALEIIAHCNAQIHTLENDITNQIELLRMWSVRLPEYVNEKVNAFVRRTVSSKIKDFNFINNVSSLILIQYILRNHNNIPKVNDLTPEQELNLFKAYLYCSQEWTDKQLSVLDGNKIESIDEFINLLLPVQLPYMEILEFKDFRFQFIKAIYFFRFCESNDIFKDYLQIFLSEYNLDSWQKYLLNILNLYVRSFEKLKVPSVISVSDEYLDIIDFLNSLSVSDFNFEISDDFLSLRENPVYKINRNNYVFLNLNFLIDKLFQGIQFEFAKVLIKKNARYKNRIISKFSDFKSIYGEEFSETGLCYRVLDYTFEKSKYIRYKGIEIKKWLIKGEPDYYMRDRAKVYLFEYKDVLLNAKTKHSYNISEIKSEIFKKLVQNERESSKGVSQLVEVIERVRNEEFNKFDEYEFDNVNIYPILIYTDSSFNNAGINHILNIEFRRQVYERGIKNQHLINDLVLIDLDTFIKFQDLFRDKRLKFNNCLYEYYNFIKSSRSPFDKLSTFNMYIHNKASKENYDSPKMLKDELLKIIPSE